MGRQNTQALPSTRGPAVVYVGINTRPPAPYKTLTEPLFKDRKVASAFNMGSRPDVGAKFVASAYGELHGLIHAAMLAFNNDHGLRLSPDSVFFTLMQGISMHINSDPEKWRRELGIKFDGRTKIEIVRDDFRLEDPDNPWEEVFTNFSNIIMTQMDHDLYTNITHEFSTTGPMESLAMDIVLMSTMSRFFEYEVSTRCSIPKIYIDGTSGDWRSIKTRIQAFLKFDLDWWIPTVVEILDKIIEMVVAHENDDVEALNVRWNDPFWSSIYNFHSRSGGDRISGWLLALFPYIGREKQVRNTCLNDWRNTKLKKTYGGLGVTLDQLPESISVVPFVWAFCGAKINMNILGGIVAVTYDEELQVTAPAFGWAVCRAFKRIGYKIDDDDDENSHSRLTIEGGKIQKRIEYMAEDLASPVKRKNDDLDSDDELPETKRNRTNLDVSADSTPTSADTDPLEAKVDRADLNRSMLENVQLRTETDCAYCGRKGSSIQSDAWAHDMTLEDYQHLLKRGWRRSGKTIWLPTNDECCCCGYATRYFVFLFFFNHSRFDTISYI